MVWSFVQAALSCVAQQPPAGGTDLAQGMGLRPGTANPRINASLEPERQPQHRPTASRKLAGQANPNPDRTGDQPRLTTVWAALSVWALSVTPTSNSARIRQRQPPSHHQSRLDDCPTLDGAYITAQSTNPRHTEYPHLASSASSRSHPGSFHPRDSRSPNPPTPLPGRRQTRHTQHTASRIHTFSPPQ